MKIKTIVIIVIILAGALAGTAQEKEKEKMPETKETKAYQAKAEDVSSIDAIIKATYDAISGDKEEKRDWDRFRSLFHKDARLIPSGTNRETGVTSANAYTPEEYIKRSEPFMMQNGFFEREIARRTEIFGTIAHVLSTYEGRNKESDEKPFLRGINSFQLLNDGKRWWIVTIYWQAETPDNPLPEKYLKSL
jgi:hypothetical protein